MDNEYITIRELMSIFLKRIRLIVIGTLLCTLISTIFALNVMKPSYEAGVKIFAGKNESIQSDYNKDDLVTYQTLIESYIEIIKTEDFMNKVIKKAKLDLVPEDILENITFIPAEGSPVLTIKYLSHSPDIAEKVVNTLTSEFEVGVKEVILNTYMKVIDSVKVIEILPQKIKIIILGFIIGVIFSLGLVLTLWNLDDTINEKDDIERLLPIPVLAELPIEGKHKHKKAKKKRKK